MSHTNWSIRTLLNPVVTRLLIYGINPMDLESIMSKIEDMVILNSPSLEKKWQTLWEEKAVHYSDLADKALVKGRKETARELFMAAAQCYFAVYLINLSSIDQKAIVYAKLSDYYFKAARFFSRPVEKIQIPFVNNKYLSACLHLPQEGRKIKGSVVFYAGLGSCKEEMNTLARTLVERDLAVLVPDMPGCGESLFSQSITCSAENVKQVYSLVLDFLNHHSKTKGLPIGSAGLCMGGGYAYNAATLNQGYHFCATLFPLFISQVPETHTPQWMRSGAWYDFQTGGAEAKSFQASMGRVTTKKLSCPFYLVHGQYDNWMTLNNAMELFELAENPNKEKLIIHQEPVFSKEEEVLHTMPVGEQIHWVRHLFVDWILDQLG
ncbi:MAG: alpha/beta hydrolase [Spirochaetales bacterium]|nr:alpha/beta hydrolase [Spirochaetales bacterium]